MHSILLLSILAAAAARTFDILTYTPPSGWKVTASKDSVTLTHGATDADACVIALFPSRPKTGDLAASFRTQWNDILVHAIHPADATPNSSPATLAGGVEALMGIAAGTAAGRPVIGTLAVLDAGDRVAPVVVLTPTADAMQGCQAPLVSFLSGITIARSNAAGGAPTPTPGSGVATLPAPLSTLSASDLVGHWKQVNSVAFQTNYYNRGTGAFTGSDTSVAINGLVFGSDRSFKYLSKGLTHGRMFDDSDSGIFEVSGVLVICKGAVRTMKLRVIGWEDRSDATLMQTIPDSLGPNPREIDVKTYSQYWVRPKAK